jgi:hypothetical protein
MTSPVLKLWHDIARLRNLSFGFFRFHIFRSGKESKFSWRAQLSGFLPKSRRSDFASGAPQNGADEKYPFIRAALVIHVHAMGGNHAT